MLGKRSLRWILWSTWGKRHFISIATEPPTNSSSWGSFSYDQAEDALQIKVKPSEIGKHEWLTYEFIERGDNYAVVALIWEELKVPIRIDVDVHPIVLNSFKDQLRSTPGFTWQAWNQAATYCVCKMMWTWNRV